MTEVAVKAGMVSGFRFTGSPLFGNPSVETRSKAVGTVGTGSDIRGDVARTMGGDT